MRGEYWVTANAVTHYPKRRTHYPGSFTARVADHSDEKLNVAVRPKATTLGIR